MKRFLKASFAATGLLIASISGLYFYFLHTPTIPVPALPGSYTRQTLQHDDQLRSYSLYQPEGLKKSAPLLLVLHGSKGSGETIRQQSAYEFDRLADQHGFLVAYPDGFDHHWNDCRSSASYRANTLNIDDVDFLSTLIQHLAREYSIDAGRVFATGFSNGGHMAFRLALEAPDMIRAIAAMAANLPVDNNLDCTKSGKPVSVAVFNGTRDPINPYNGGLIQIGQDTSRGEVLSTDDTLAYWLELAQIHTPSQIHEYPETDDNPQTRVVAQHWQQANGIRIRLYRLEGSGHVIASKQAHFPRILGEKAGDISGPGEIVRFFLSD